MPQAPLGYESLERGSDVSIWSVQGFSTWASPLPTGSWAQVEADPAAAQRGDDRGRVLAHRNLTSGAGPRASVSPAGAPKMKAKSEEVSG
jgi:hypothetical protein